MENKNVGFLILGIAVIMLAVVLIFSNTLKDTAQIDCQRIHGTSVCPMYDTITKQTYLALSLVAIIFVIGLILLFAKPKEKIVFKTVREKIKKKKIDTSDFRPEEKLILKYLENTGAVFQAELIEKTGFGKAKVSRILDKLENKGIIERKRRGMTNIVVLK